MTPRRPALRRLRALILPLVLSAAAAGAQNAQQALQDGARYDPDLFELVRGVFCEVPSTGSVPAPGTVAGKIELFDAVPDFQWLTSVVPAVPGISFGVQTLARDGRIYDNVVMTLTHPAFRDSGASTQSYVTALGGSDTAINAYTFDTPEELATGTWTFTATRDDELIYSARFEVVPPAAAPEIASACGGLPMS
ncbi:DUF3859 domain-containing protein [Roseivivax isoporae]|uniref:DUF3859 domain-containing protein n=1 Tax=Roseivivax isoporae LMG 25204 TaxID=1449351 RepID=X7FE65_9RHOB|nr:DUF3859 domain-containing protein [Roseivivax isoporae]ETX31023.1 hypothetical protein RISW2_00445 [Roseivivax isoporae LMG 25204]